MNADNKPVQPQPLSPASKRSYLAAIHAFKNSQHLSTKSLNDLQVKGNITRSAPPSPLSQSASIPPTTKLSSSTNEKYSKRSPRGLDKYKIEKDKDRKIDKSTQTFMKKIKQKSNESISLSSSSDQIPVSASLSPHALIKESHINYVGKKKPRVSSLKLPSYNRTPPPKRYANTLSEKPKLFVFDDSSEDLQASPLRERFSATIIPAIKKSEKTTNETIKPIKKKKKKSQNRSMSVLYPKRTGTGKEKHRPTTARKRNLEDSRDKKHKKSKPSGNWFEQTGLEALRLRKEAKFQKKEEERERQIEEEKKRKVLFKSKEEEPFKIPEDPALLKTYLALEKWKAYEHQRTIKAAEITRHNFKLKILRESEERLLREVQVKKRKEEEELRETSFNDLMLTMEHKDEEIKDLKSEIEDLSSLVSMLRDTVGKLQRNNSPKTDESGSWLKGIMKKSGDTDTIPHETSFRKGSGSFSAEDLFTPPSRDVIHPISGDDEASKRLSLPLNGITTMKKKLKMMRVEEERKRKLKEELELKKEKEDLFKKRKAGRLSRVIGRGRVNEDEELLGDYKLPNNANRKNS